MDLRLLSLFSSLIGLWISHLKIDPNRFIDKGGMNDKLKMFKKCLALLIDSEWEMNEPWEKNGCFLIPV